MKYVRNSSIELLIYLNNLVLNIKCYITNSIKKKRKTKLLREDSFYIWLERMFYT